MARGWESKSVEAQQEQAAEKTTLRPRLTLEEQEQQRQREGILLSRKRLVEQLSSAQNPRYQKLLKDALRELDERLASIPSTILGK